MSDLCANQSVSGVRSGGDAPRQFDLCTGKDKATSCAFRMASRSLIYRKNGNNIDIWNNTFSRPWRLARRCAPGRPPTHRSLRPGAERPPAAARRRRPSRRAAPPSGLALLRHLFDTSGSIAAAIVVPEAQSRWGQKLVSYRPLAALGAVRILYSLSRAEIMHMPRPPPAAATPRTPRRRRPRTRATARAPPRGPRGPRSPPTEI